MISILEVSGLKFTSQSFQLEFMLRQMMIIKEKPLFNKCLIKIVNPSSIAPTPPELDSDAESDISIEDISTNAVIQTNTQSTSELMVDVSNNI